MSGLTVDIRDKTYPAQAGKAAHQALATLDFTVPDGQFVCLVGPSGCGKTTMLNLIGGLDAGFDGWCTVEQDCDPTGDTSPIDDARANRTYLHSIGFQVV